MKLLWAPWRIDFILGHKNVTGCVFCELPKAKDDRSSLILGRSSSSFAILNKYPYSPGHTLIVPFAHTANLKDLPDETLLDVHRMIRDTIGFLTQSFSPHGFNVGMNLGEAGGAGIRDHLHYHVVPRWSGDTNFMPVLGETKVLPESLEKTYDQLAPRFRR